MILTALREVNSQRKQLLIRDFTYTATGTGQIRAVPY